MRCDRLDAVRGSFKLAKCRCTQGIIRDNMRLAFAAALRLDKLRRDRLRVKRKLANLVRLQP